MCELKIKNYIKAMERIKLIQSQLRSSPLSNNNTLTITDNRTGI